MFCLNDVIENYDMAVKCLSARHLGSAIRFRSKIDAVFAMLSDDDSRRAYGQALMYRMLSNFVKQDDATEIAGNITMPEFNARVSQARNMPKFSMIAHPETARAGEFKWLDIATVFLME